MHFLRNIVVAICLLIVAAEGNGQVFWTEDFDNPPKSSSGLLASSYVGVNGGWTLSAGINDLSANEWYVSAAECGNAAGQCGSACSDTDPSLHVGNVSSSPLAFLCPTGEDCGAAYDAGIGNNNVTTDKRIESPTINCSGWNNITLKFNYLEFGEGSNDNATLMYYDGSGWSQLADPNKTACCGGVCNGFRQGLWTEFTILLPCSANNNPNVKIGFRWVNDDNGMGTDPSFAVDDITLSASAPLQIYAHGTDPTCATNCNGTATVDVVGGTSPYTYSWSSGQTTQAINSLCGGTYTVTVTDANGCISSTTSVIPPGCFQIQSILVDACTPTEAPQEMVFFQVGQAPLNYSSLITTWPTAGNTWDGLCTNQTFINNVNLTITGGGILLPAPISGILPAGANVVLITSDSLNTTNTNFSSLSDTLYVLFQCDDATTVDGNFGNYNSTPGTRTLTMNFGSGCTDVVQYDVSLLINTSGTPGGSAAIRNGASVYYSSSGTATYINKGCVIPSNVQTAYVTLTAPAPVAVVVTPDSPTICSGGSISLTASGATTYVWSPTTGLSPPAGNVATVLANPTTTTTYTVTGTFNGCTGSIATTVWVVPTPTLTPDPPCAGQATAFTAGNGAWYEFTVNGTSQGAPSATNTFTSGILTAGDVVCVKSYPVPPFVYDGNISELEWGNPLATSAGGPAISGFGNNRIDALYMKNLNGTLSIAVAGNEEDGIDQARNNRILLFIDSKAGGVNNLSGASWPNRSNSPPFTDGVKNLNGGIIFDAGFNADYILAMNQANNSGQTYYDLYDIINNSNIQIGTGPSPQFGFQANAATGDTTKGFEFSFPMSLIGSPTNSIKVFAMLINDPGPSNAAFLSNQFLTRAGPAQGNYTDVAVNFNNEPPNPVTYLVNADCSTPKCVTAIAPITPVTGFSYTTPVCANASNQSPTLAVGFANGGTFSSNSTNLSINSSTGLINVSASIAGTYTVTYTLAASGCQLAATSTFSITISPLPLTSPIFHN